MLLDLLHRFRTCRIVLASQSPRRVEILQKLRVGFEVLPSKFAEDMDWRSFASPVGAMMSRCLGFGQWFPVALQAIQASRR